MFSTPRVSALIRLAKALSACENGIALANVALESHGPYSKAFRFQIKGLIDTSQAAIDAAQARRVWGVA